MTTIITRLYDSDSAAKAVQSDLDAAGFPANTVDVIGGSGNAAEQMEAARVNPAAAAAYAPLVDKGNKLVVVRAPFVPFGAAKTAKQIVDSHGPVDAGVETQDELLNEEMKTVRQLSVLKDHPLLLTKRSSIRKSTVSKSMGMKLLSQRKERTSAVGRSGHWSTPILDIPLIRRAKRDISAFTGTRRFGAFLFPLILKRDPGRKVKRSGGTPFSDAFGMPLIIRR